MRRVTLVSIICYSSIVSAVPQPHFSARRDYPASGFVQVADVNGDGISDVIGIQDFKLETLLGNGNGTFRPGPTTDLPAWSPFAGVPVDLNGDGKVDLILSGGPNGAVPSGIGVLFGNGDGTFQAPIFYAAGNDKLGGTLTVGDFNGDGIPDAVTTTESGIWLFTGKGGGIFNSAVLTPIDNIWFGGLASADLNGDGKLDLVVGYSTGPALGFAVFHGKGNGTFAARVNYPGLGYISWITVGDLNSDGHLDLLVSGPSIYLNNGKGGFAGPTAVTLPGGPVAIGDVNGDHILDLVSSSGYVALGLGHAKFALPICYPVESSGTINVVLADLRRHGILDIVAGESNGLSVLLNKGAGTFSDGEWISIPGSGNCAAAADFNGDGKPDLAVATAAGITVLFGTGKATAPYITGPSTSVSGVACPITGDLNSDGIPDLLVGANGLGGVGAYLGNGDGTFRLTSVTPVGPATNLVLGDFNHDGKPDFAASSNQLALGNGDGTFQASTTIFATLPPPGYMSWIAAGDVNNDGWTDVLATQPEYCCGALYVLLNDQHGGFTLSTIPNSGLPTTVMVADLNLDGNLDAIVEAAAPGNVDVYLGNGRGDFKLLSKTIPYQGPDILPPQVGDVNGDGIPDILLPADGSIGVALGRGNGSFLAPIFVGAGPSLGQVFMLNLHGQSTSVGLPDLVAPDGTGGVTVLINKTK